MFRTRVNGLKKIILRYQFKSTIILSLVLFFYACAKEPDKLGRDLLPSSDNIIVKADTSTVIKSYSISGKPVYTSDNTQSGQIYVLGSLKDSIFGNSSASILTRFHPAFLASADTIRTVDSLVLYLSSKGNYGDTMSNMTLRVYELIKAMEPDSNYYSNIDPNEYCIFTPEMGSTTFRALDTQIIRIRITDAGILNRFETIQDTVFKDLDLFEAQFLGFYLRVDPVTEKGGYSYLNMSSFDTRLTMYYNGKKNNDTISYEYEMSFTNIAAKANVFTHDYSGFPIAGRLNSPESNDSLIFIEGLAGSGGHISFSEPEFKEWRDKPLITINQAELILPVDTIMYASLSRDNYPPKLILYSVGDDDSYKFLYDYRIDDNTGSYFDGSYDITRNAYVFNIGLHLQSYISGKIENSDLVLLSRQSNSTANRVILKGANSVNSPIKLKVIYTELF